MASTNKTPKLGLNQWAAGDSVLREDFNGDNGKIEAAVVANQLAAAAAASAAVKMKTGTYCGNGVGHKNIDVGFAPKLVILSVACATKGIVIVTADVVFNINNGNSPVSGSDSLASFHLTPTGFFADQFEGNADGYHCYYAAFG